MKHVMIDLETMGTRPDAAIVAIGAVAFDMPTRENPAPKLGRSFYVNVDLQSSIDAGLTVSGDTVYWWLQQEEAARNKLLDNRVGLLEALGQFSDFFSTEIREGYKYPGAEYLWAHGLDFDVGIMRTAYDNFGVKHPWYYNKVRDDRTLYDVTGQPPWDDLGVLLLGLDDGAHMCPHNALYDAKVQALGAMWAQNRINFLHYKAGEHVFDEMGLTKDQLDTYLAANPGRCSSNDIFADDDTLREPATGVMSEESQAIIGQAIKNGDFP